jgi:hypothetical protein
MMLFLCFSSFGAKVSGKVSNTQGEALPFSTIYLLNTTIGTTTNTQGEYSLELPPGTYTLVFKYVGLQPFFKVLQIQNQDIELNVTLESEKIQPKPVAENPKKDPAYDIIKKASKKRRLYEKEVNSYKCNVYLKGMQRLNDVPKKLMLFPNSPDTGIVYLSETLSELNYKHPKAFKEKIFSTREIGKNYAFTYTKASEWKANFYHILVSLDGISDRGFISPIYRNGFLHYKYKLEGIMNIDGTLVNKIKVTGIRKTDPVFNGYIYIVEDSWRIYSLDLYVTKANPANNIDTLKINQVFTPVEDGKWMLLSQRFEYQFRDIAYKGTGYHIGIHTNYKLEPGFKKRYFDREIMIMETDALNKDNLYWQSIRPVPLTKMEEMSYQRNDSLDMVAHAEKNLDSLDALRNKASFKHVFFGYSYRNSKTNTFFRFDPIFKIIQYNTVEGFAPNVQISYTQLYDDRTFLKVTPSFRYGFSNEKFNAKIHTQYYYNPKKFAFSSIGVGRYIDQFNSEEAVTPYLSSYAMLFLQRNYLKLYHKQFINFAHQTELFNGVLFSGSIEYARRSELFNTSLFSLYPFQGEGFTPNAPANASLPNTHFDSHLAFIVDLNLRIRIKQRYYSTPKEKFILDSPFPTININYRRGIPNLLGSSMDFDHLMVSIDKTTKLGLIGTSNFLVSAGTYLNTNNMTFIDYKHFNGNLVLLTHYYPNDFYLLDYYLYSTNRTYYTAHFEHHFQGFIINKIPYIKRTKLQVVTSAHYLYTNESRHYLEVGVGLENIFKVGRIDLFTSFNENGPYQQGIRMGITGLL